MGKVNEPSCIYVDSAKDKDTEHVVFYCFSTANRERLWTQAQQKAYKYNHPLKSYESGPRVGNDYKLERVY